jgi:hypothetical protein
MAWMVQTTSAADTIEGMDSHPKPRDVPSSLPPAGLLVVSIDRLPAWMLAAYGATWVATPALDGLAACGVVFDRVITPSTAARDTLHDLLAASPHSQTLLAEAAVRGWRPMFVTDDAAVAAGLTAGDGRSTVGVRLVEAVAKETVEDDDTQTGIARLVDAALEVIADLAGTRDTIEELI